MRKMVQFQVSAELMRQALAMPNGTNIYNITRHDFNPDVFTFFVEHPDFNEVVEGSAPPEITPVITADNNKRSELWLTFDWGLPAQQTVQAENLPGVNGEGSMPAKSASNQPSNAGPVSA